MRYLFTLFAAAIAAVIFAAAAAHEGHDHGKLMGTVKTVDAKAGTIQVETAGGETTLCVVNAATKLVRGDKAAALADVRVGERVVVRLDKSATPPIADEIKLAPSTAAPTVQKPEHDHSSPNPH